MMTVVILCVASIFIQCYYAECHYAEYHYAKCHYVQCHYAEFHGALMSTPIYTNRQSIRWADYKEKSDKL